MSTTGRLRRLRTTCRASFAAIATSHAPTWSGSRRVGSRRQAIAQACWVASRAASTSAVMAYATRAIDG